jgi:uncharacterized repeat protein (TIGR04138 family)
MQKINVQDALDQIRKKDPRYDRDAYLFVREALDHTLKLMKKNERVESIRGSRETVLEAKKMTHVSGQELLNGVRDLAVKQFGPLSKTVLEHWGITRCEDFGEIVFNMVEVGLLGKTEKDSKADFAGGYSFDEAFVKPFVPRSKASEVNRATESVEPAAEDQSKN